MPAQEGRNLELVILAPVMHRSMPAVLVQALGRWALGVFGYRFRTLLLLTGRRPPGKSLLWRMRHWR